MSDKSPDEQTEQGPELDWAALKLAVDEIVAALTLVRDNLLR